MAAREACEGERTEDLKPSEEAGKKRPDVQEERNAKGAELHPTEGSGKEEQCCCCCWVQPVQLDDHHWIGEASSEQPHIDSIVLKKGGSSRGRQLVEWYCVVTPAFAAAAFTAFAAFAAFAAIARLPDLPDCQGARLPQLLLDRQASFFQIETDDRHQYQCCGVRNASKRYRV